MKDSVIFECYNPQGKVETPEIAGLTNSRVSELAGKKIGIFWDGKMGGDNFCIAIEELLNERYPTSRTVRLAWGDIEAAEKARKEVDTFIYAVGDSGMGGWGQCLQVIDLEKQGKPGVFIVGDNALNTAKMSARDNGLPALRIVSLPSIDYYPNRLTVDGLRPLARKVIDNIIDALTRPLTPEEKKPELLARQEIPEKIQIKAESYESALTSFNSLYLDNHWGDGLPMIPPTEESVKQMLTGTTRSPEEVIGQVPFRNGTATTEKIAINAVMAGARPEYLPVIITAMECLIDDTAFSHMMSSEGSFTLMIIVNGPIGKEIKMNSGVGLLGHGWQANNTIGRAVRLCLINLGYLWPGEIDMALIGRPSSHTFYTFAENMEQSPWESFNEGLGYRKEDSSVTVSTVGLGSRTYGGGVVEPWDVNRVLESLVKDVAGDRIIFRTYKRGVANPIAHFRKHIMVIHPELAVILRNNGFTTKQSLKEYIYENSKVPYEELSEEEIQGIKDRINTKPGGMFFVNDAIPEDQMPMYTEALKPGGKVPVVDSDNIHIVVSGSIPGYSFGMSYFRSAHQTKLIKDAALTEAGR